MPYHGSEETMGESESGVCVMHIVELEIPTISWSKIYFCKNFITLNWGGGRGGATGGTRGHVPPNTKLGGGHKWPCAPQSKFEAPKIPPQL